MWNKALLGTDLYHLIQWFLAYSILGWFVESVYMSFCNRKLTNRGFAKGPICPIYGFGALGAYFLLQPIRERYVLLYICGAVLATVFEFLVARLMTKLFGEVWWDYSEKPFNYKGVLCLESTIAWGFYTVIMFAFLHGFVERIVSSYSQSTGTFVGKWILIFMCLDMLHTLYRTKKESITERALETKERIWKIVGR